MPPYYIMLIGLVTVTTAAVSLFFMCEEVVPGVVMASAVGMFVMKLEAAPGDDFPTGVEIE